MARVRHVWPTHMVAHIWANQSQGDARNPSGNLYFSGDTLYSYRDSFPIARIIKHKGKTCVLISNDTYSVTTAGHCRLAESASRQFTQFTVPNRTLSKEPYYKNHGWEPAKSRHDANIHYFKTEIERATKRLVKGRDKISYLDLLDRAIKEANRYLEFFDLKKRFAWPEDLDRAALEAKGKEWQGGAEKRSEAAVKAREKRWANRQEEWRKRQEEYEKQRAFNALKHEEQRAAWLAGEPGSHYFRTTGGGALLRINGDVLETSAGAQVPLDHARRVFSIIASCRQRGVSFPPASAQAEGFESAGDYAPRVGHFRINRIDAEGNIVAGCHTIAWSEIERIAGQLGLLEKREEVLSNGQAAE